MLDNTHLRGIGIDHPGRQKGQRPIPLRDDIRTLLPKAVCTPNAQSFAVSRMEAVMNSHLKEMRMGSMSLA